MRFSLLALALFALADAAQAQGLKVGAASVDITPKVGTPMAGYYYERPSEGVHDPLFVKAIVLEAGGQKAALVSLDLISTTFSMVADAREEIERLTGIKGENVMISATHAHTGPILTDRSARAEAFGGDRPLSVEWNKALPRKIAGAVKAANDNLKPASASVAKGQEPAIAFNRRFHMIDGTVGWNPGKLNPKIVKSAGPIDPDVDVVYFETADEARKPIATYVNHAVHLDNVGGAQFSADMPATISDLLGRFKGPEMVTVYTSGCCGDINHIDVTWSERQGGHDNAARMGVILSGEVLKRWRDLKPAKASYLRVKTAKVKLPLAPISTEDVAAARATFAKMEESKVAPPFLEHVKAYQVLDVEARKGEPLEVEVQVVALDDQIAWVSLPGEIFVELGMEIKQDSPFPNTIIAELSNGVIGYIPVRRAYKQGNYEVVSARCAEGSGEMLVDAAVRMLKELHIEAGESPK